MPCAPPHTQRLSSSRPIAGAAATAATALRGSYSSPSSAPSPAYRVHSFNAGTGTGGTGGSGGSGATGTDSASSSGKGSDAIEKWAALAGKAELAIDSGGMGGIRRGGSFSVGSPGLLPDDIAGMVTPKVAA